jgi:hypothetical protein
MANLRLAVGGRACLPAVRLLTKRGSSWLVMIWGGVKPRKIGCKLLLCTWFDNRSERGDRVFSFFLSVCLFDATYVRKKRVMI